MRRAAIYVRVSTSEQTTENQTDRLREVASRAGWEIVAVYDETVSGAAGLDRRAEYAAMLRAAARRQFDVLIAWDVSRLGRSLAGLVGLMEQLRTLKVDVYIDQQGLDTTTPAGRAMFQMAGVFAEFERGMLIERTRAGMARARARGVHIGRPPVRASVEARIKELRGDGLSINRIASMLKVGKSVVGRVCSGEVAASAAGECGASVGFHLDTHSKGPAYIYPCHRRDLSRGHALARIKMNYRARLRVRPDLRSLVS